MRVQYLLGFPQGSHTALGMAEEQVNSGQVRTRGHKSERGEGGHKVRRDLGEEPRSLPNGLFPQLLTHSPGNYINPSMKVESHGTLKDPTISQHNS